MLENISQKLTIACFEAIQSQFIYSYFAEIANQEELVIIGNIFNETSCNKKEHAKVLYKYILNTQNNVDIPFQYILGNTSANLVWAAKHEKNDIQKLYLNTIKVANEEQDQEIVELFNNLLDINKRHAYRFEFLSNELGNNAIYKKKETSQWLCTNCGYIKISAEAPCFCPVCNSPKTYFHLFCEKFF